MANIPDKLKIKQEVLLQLKEQQRLLAQVVQTAADASTHAEAKPEGKYDTRAIESSYLAGAQTERLLELNQKIQSIERMDLLAPIDLAVKITSLVLLTDEDGKSLWYMLIPGAAALKICTDGIWITILSPESRLGADLLGKSEGDDIETGSGKQARSLLIEKIY